MLPTIKHVTPDVKFEIVKLPLAAPDPELENIIIDELATTSVTTIVALAV